MKIRTLVIVPYEGLREVVKQVSQNQDMFDIEIYLGNLEEGVDIAKGKEASFDLIISRGGTAALIEKEVSIPVIDIQVSGYDMLRVLTLVNGYPGKAVIVGFENISQGASTICSLLELDIQTLTIDSGEEVYEVLKELDQKGYQLVIGDVVTVNAAKNMGLTGVLITSGHEAVLEAFEEARSVYRLYSSLNRELSLFKSILHGQNQAWIIFNENGKVVDQSQEASRLFATLSQNEKDDIKKMAIEHLKEENNQLNVVRSQRDIWFIECKRIECSDEIYSFIQLEKKIEKTTEWSGVEFDIISSAPIINGVSDSIIRIKENIPLIAETNHSVWIQGEVGTEKELIAHSIHRQSNRSSLPFVTIHCELIKDDEWGHVLQKLSNTSDSLGSLYFNNIDRTSTERQNEIRKFIQRLEGAPRVIVSSMEDVLSKVNRELFNQELYFTLSAINITIPPIRDRKEDIESSIQYYISVFHGKYGKQVVGIKKEGIELLKEFSWPGNVKQLRQIIEQLVIQSSGYYIETAEVEKVLQSFDSRTGVGLCNINLHATLQEMERQIILQVLEEEENNQSNAAKRLGINRSTLWRKLK